MRNKFSTTVENMPSSGIRKFFDLVIGADDIISLGVGEPDFSTPWRISEEAYHSLEIGKTCYTSNWGLIELREAISDYLKKTYNCHYAPENEILITVGVSEGMDIALRAIINPGDEVIIPEPAYVSYAPLTSLAGGKPVSIDTTETKFKVTAEQIRSKVTDKTKAIILTYPNNPTGATIDKEELIKIAQIVKENDLWVISDEIYAELTYEGEHECIAAIEGMKEHTLLLKGFSKAYAMTGWRIGYLCGSQEALSRAVKIHQYSILCAPIMSQHAALEAILCGNKEVEYMKNSYRQRCNIFTKSMNKIGLTTHTPEGAFYAFPSIKSTGMSSEEFALKLLESQKVAVVPGNAFGKCGEGYIRCCYATDLNELKTAINKIERFVSSL